MICVIVTPAKCAIDVLSYRPTPQNKLEILQWIIDYVRMIVIATKIKNEDDPNENEFVLVNTSIFKAVEWWGEIDASHCQTTVFNILMESNIYTTEHTCDVHKDSNDIVSDIVHDVYRKSVPLYLSTPWLEIPSTEIDYDKIKEWP